MRRINCVIVDDEPLALALLEEYVEKTPFLHLVGKAESAREAMEILEENPVDLLFLDIHMPGLNGLEFAQTLQEGPRIIFATAYDHYAIEGFRLDAVDYLLKPYEYKDFLRAAQRAKKAIQASAASQGVAEAEFLFVKVEFKWVRVDLDDILYIEGLKDYAQIHLRNQSRPLTTLARLKTLHDRLPQNRFLRIHRSYIANLRHVSVIENGKATIGTERIPIGETQRAQLEYRLSQRA